VAEVEEMTPPTDSSLRRWDQTLPPPPLSPPNKSAIVLLLALSLSRNELIAQSRTLARMGARAMISTMMTTLAVLVPQFLVPSLPQSHEMRTSSVAQLLLERLMRRGTISWNWRLKNDSRGEARKREGGWILLMSENK
jgi:hypothetical protein